MVPQVESAAAEKRGGSEVEVSCQLNVVSPCEQRWNAGERSQGLFGQGVVFQGEGKASAGRSSPWGSRMSGEGKV